MVFIAFSNNANWSSWVTDGNGRGNGRGFRSSEEERHSKNALSFRAAHLVREGFALEVGELLLHERVGEDGRHVV